MAEIIKTWPAFMTPEKVLEIFNGPWPDFYFTIGRGKPRVAIERIWFTHRGRIVGSFKIGVLAKNDGSFPTLQRLDGGESEWQIKRDAWVVVCKPPFQQLNEVVFHESHRGWRYFDFEKHRGSVDASINMERERDDVPKMAAADLIESEGWRNGK